MKLNAKSKVDNEEDLGSIDEAGTCDTIDYR